MADNVFSQFTNQYALSKTLRFELRPAPQTRILISKNNILKKDEEIDRLYQEEMKPMLDELHGRFIQETLAEKVFEENILQRYYDLVSEYKQQSLKKEKDKKKLDELKNNINSTALDLRKSVVDAFKKTAEVWKTKYATQGIKLKDAGYKILTESSIREVLLHEFPDKKEIINEFKGFWTYFGGYNQNRENYYSEEAKATAVSYRAVDENLSRYIENIMTLKKVIEKIPELKSYEESLEINVYNLYLNQEGIDRYNIIIGGHIDANDKKIQGINEKINLYCQQNKTKLPKLKTLYKQIGSDKKGLEIFAIENGKEWGKLKEMLQLQSKVFDHNGKKIKAFESLKNMYKEFFSEVKNFPDVRIYDLERIYFNKISINTISNNWFTSWKTLADLLKIKVDKKSEEQKIPSQISLAEMKDALVPLTEENRGYDALFKSSDKSGKNRKAYFGKNAWVTFLNIWQSEIEDNFSKLEALQSQFEKESTRKFQRNDKTQTSYIKNVCDALLVIERMAKYHIPKDTNLSQDEDFYWIIDTISNEREIFKYYNAFRNHLTKKPYSQDKIKLNFECGSLLGGWSDGQERNKLGVILKNNDKVYLGILIDRSLFRTDRNNNPIYKVKNSTSPWKRLLLSNLKFQTLAGKGFLGEYGESYGKMNPEKSVSLLQEFIQKKYVKKYPQLTKVTQEKFLSKKTFDAQIKEVLKECFTMDFIDISADALFDAENKGTIYLFQISNKDFLKKSLSKENIHSIYWRALFSEENCKNPFLALNGGAEVFYRPSQKEKLQKKKDKKGKEVFDGKRYSEDKLLFHVPITINYGKPKNIKLKELINNSIKSNNINIIGIDRGEKHLIYYSIINTKGEILKQGTLNTIKVGEKEVNFNEKLTKRANEMMEARQNWEEIGNIKNFKEGYLSQVVHEIYKLMIEHNAVLVLEDLNTEFKAKRTAKVEKSVYKKFELALARKLNHLILKEKTPNEIGGVLHGYQLTPPIGAGDVSKFEKAKQWGIIFYVTANYTSITDPVSGWRKHVYITNSAKIDEIKKFFNPDNKEPGIKIFYSETFQAWGFQYKQKDTGKEWELIAAKSLERFRYDPEKKENKAVNLHTEFEKLFENVKDKSGNIYDQISDMDDFHWKSLVYLWNLLNQIRNTDKKVEGNENDFIFSPVYSSCIKDFFDSRKDYDFVLPENGDANGAYNIARKGLMLMSRIKENPQNYDQFIRNVDWDKFVQNID